MKDSKVISTEVVITFTNGQVETLKEPNFVNEDDHTYNVIYEELIGHGQKRCKARSFPKANVQEFNVTEVSEVDFGKG